MTLASALFLVLAGVAGWAIVAGRRLPPEVRGRRVVPWVAGLGLVLTLAAPVVTSVALVRAFAAVARVPQPDKARVLAAGISDAMGFPTLLLAVATPLVLGAVVAIVRARRPR